MATLITIVLFISVIVIALYAFGFFSTPYLNAFRFAFYLLLVLLTLSIWYGVIDHSYQGYEPIVRTP